MGKSYRGDIIEVSLVDRLSDNKYFKGKADISNLRQMKLLYDLLKEKGVYFPE